MYTLGKIKVLEVLNWPMKCLEFSIIETLFQQASESSVYLSHCLLNLAPYKRFFFLFFFCFL